MKIDFASVLREKAQIERLNALTDSYRCRGRIRAEGDLAKPSFCFRERSEGKGYAKTTVLELHSKVTGRQIGFFGYQDKPFVKEKAEARVWKDLNGRFAPNEFRRLLHDAQEKSPSAWRESARESLKRMEREAMKK